jgi:D-inositol-3-phosphate glycosyltransferase
MNLYVRRLADELAERGMRVDVFTRRTDHHTPRIVQSASGARFIHLDAGPARRLPKNVLPIHIPDLVTAFRQFVQEEQASYSVIHAHYWLSGLVAIRSRAFTGAPVITMFHTLSRVKEQHAGHRDPLESDLRNDGERCVISGSDVVVGATHQEQSLMQTLYGRSPQQFVVIPPGVDLNRFRPMERTVCRSILGWTDKPIILFVGRFDPMKGLDTLLHALAQQRQAIPEGTRLVVAGGDGHGGTRFKHLAHTLGIDDMVDFHGLVPPDELPLFYAAADVTAVPSVYESFGMAAIESMASGTPVVAFDVGGLATTVIHERTGILVEPRHTAAFGRALTHTLTRSDRRAMGRRARAHASAYEWGRSITSTLQLYDNVATTHRCLCSLMAGA